MTRKIIKRYMPDAHKVRTHKHLRIFGKRLHEPNLWHLNRIRLAAEDLAKKLCALCPACGTPGFGIVERVAGLACADCGAPTRETRAEVHGCLKCAHRETRERADRQYADPGRCDYCNP